MKAEPNQNRISKKFQTETKTEWFRRKAEPNRNRISKKIPDRNLNKPNRLGKKPNQTETEFFLSKMNRYLLTTKPVFKRKTEPKPEVVLTKNRTKLN